LKDLSQKVLVGCVGLRLGPPTDHTTALLSTTCPLSCSDAVALRGGVKRGQTTDGAVRIFVGGRLLEPEDVPVIGGLCAVGRRTINPKEDDEGLGNCVGYLVDGRRRARALSEPWLALAAFYTLG
jgi:hypothetical protein